MKATKIEAEINFKNGKRTIEMELKEDYEIHDCEVEKVIMLNLFNGENYTGIFKGMDDDQIMLGSLSGENTIGLSIAVVNDYFEEL